MPGLPILHSFWEYPAMQQHTRLYMKAQKGKGLQRHQPLTQCRDLSCMGNCRTPPALLQLPRALRALMMSGVLASPSSKRAVVMSGGLASPSSSKKRNV